MEEKQQPEHPDNEDIKQISVPPNKEEVNSEFTERYFKALTFILQNTSQKLHDFSKKNITYKDGQYKEFNYSIEEEHNNYKVVVVKVEIGCFVMHLTLLNLDKRSPFSLLTTLSEGEYGKIYSLQLNGKNVAIKSFDTSRKAGRVMSRAIQEYCIYKICDCLECGPSVQNYLGFDLISYSNRVEFVMERCQHVPINEVRYNQLLENMYIMHRFQIVHSDITNLNFMFSRSQGKVVFIDFGLSKIIREEIGLKTYTSFRGTPTFVSEAMLDLLGVKSKWNFVDLYFNDLVCLQKVYGYQKQKMRFSETFGEMEEQQSSSQQSQPPLNEEHQKRIQDQYQIYPIIHQAYFYPQAFKNSLQSKHQQLPSFQPGKILQIIKFMLPSPFFESILFNEMKKFQKFSQYQECLSLLKNRYISPLKNTENNNFYQRFYQRQIQCFQEEQSLQKRKQQIINFFETKKEGRDDEALYDLIFDCLRFDTKNFKLTDKQELANAFLKSLSMEVQTQTTLNGIKQVIQIVISFCLSKPITPWKTEHRLPLLTQAILLDLPLLSSLSSLLELVKSRSFKKGQLIHLMYEYVLLDKVLEVKYKFQDFEHYKKVIIKVKEGEQLVRQLINKVGESSQAEENLVLRIIKEQGTVLSKHKLFSSFCSLKRSLLKKMIMKYIFIKEFSRAIKINDYSLFILIMRKAQGQFSQQLTASNLAEQFFWKTIHSQQIVALSRKNKQQNSSLKQKINCDSIYQKLTFYLSDLQIENSTNRSLFVQSVSDLLKACFEHNRFCVFQTNFQGIISCFFEDQKMCSENVDVLVEIAEQYLQFLTDELSDSEGKIEMIRAYEGYFYTFLLHLGERFEVYIKRYQSIIRKVFWRYLSRVLVQDFEGQSKIPQFLYFSLLKRKHLQGNDLNKLMLYQRKVMKIDDSDLPPFIFKATFKQLLRVVEILEKQPKEGQLLDSIHKLLIWGWKYHKYHHSILSYFEENQENIFIIYQTLKILWSGSLCSRQQTYQFLKDIVEALSSRPLSMESKSFFLSLVKFHRIHPQFFTFNQLKIKLGAICWKDRYKILCFALCIRSAPIQDKISALKFTILQVDSLNWVSKEVVFNFYFQNLLLLVVLKYLSFPVRKLVYVQRFLATKIQTDSEGYQKRKIKMFLQLVKLNKKKRPKFKQLLRNKILEWKRKDEPPKNQRLIVLH